MIKDIIIDFINSGVLNNNTELCNIMHKYGSDKGITSHNYTILYDFIFKDRKTEIRNVFEVGLGTNDITIKSNMGVNGKPGASIYGWREYFPNANIFGADIDKKILFSSERINTFFCDQTNPEIITDMWNHELLKNIEFDLIVDDGLHDFSANKCFLENSFHKLKSGGIFIIEDIMNHQIEQFKNLINNYPDSVFIKIPYQRNNFDNNLAIIRK